MRLLRVQPGASPANLPLAAIVCHDVRNPAQRSEILARKGTALRASEIELLLERGVVQLHMALPDARDLPENEAAERIAAAAVVGARVKAGEAHNGQVSLISSARGMLRVHGERLERVNEHDGVLVLTAEADRAVDPGTTLGIVKCAPLFLPESTILALEAAATAAGPVLEIEPFRPKRVALVAPRERLRGGAFDRAQAALSAALTWFGSSLDRVVGADASVPALAAAYQAVCHDGAELVLAAGASATDPMDILFDGLREAGGEVLQIGIPVEPGTACWIGRLDSIPVLGLASCELFGRPGALDLLLPRLLTDEGLDRRLLRRLARGGLLLGPSRVAPYHAGDLADE